MTHIHLTWTNSAETSDSGSDSFQLPIKIGRSSSNTIALKGKNAGVSRQHAELRRENGTIILADLGSTNGTIIDGRNIRDAILHSGSQFEIGTYRFALELQVICTSKTCGRAVSINQQTCPHCGRFLADAQTHLL